MVVLLSGNTASNLTCNLNGISSPGDLSADSDLFTTSVANNLFAVDSNLVLDSPWEVNIALNVLVTNNIALSSVTLNVFILSNSGRFQGSERHLDINASIFAMPTTLLSSVGESVYANGNGFTNCADVSFDFTGVSLLAGNSYFLN